MTRISAAMASALASSTGKWLARSWKKSRASSVGSRIRRPVGRAMPPLSSRATRQARYSASMARPALGALPAKVEISSSGTCSSPSSGSDSTSRSPVSSAFSRRPERAAISTSSASVSLMQQGRGDGALVVLDQVQVAGGNAEPGGQRLLRQALLLPQPAHRPADQRPCHDFTPFTEST